MKYGIQKHLFQKTLAHEKRLEEPREKQTVEDAELKYCHNLLWLTYPSQNL